MIEREEDRSNIETWPPAIAVLATAQPQIADKTVRVGRLSVWLAAAGVVCWIGAVAALILVDSFTSGRINSLPILKVVYILGIALELVSLRCGFTGRKIKAGKVGLTLSMMLFACMVAATLVDHYQDAQHQWFWTSNIATIVGVTMRVEVICHRQSAGRLPGAFFVGCRRTRTFVYAGN